MSTQDTPEHAPDAGGTDLNAAAAPESAQEDLTGAPAPGTPSAALPEALTGSEGADAGEEPGGTEDDRDRPEEGLGAPTLDAALEAVLLVTDQPLDVATLAALVRRPADEVLGRLRALSDEYAEARRGFDLREAAGGWRFYTRAECSEVVERYVRDGQQARLTQAALETLAVVAYRQPVSRARISAVRGVNVDGVMRTLTTRGLVAEAGHDESSGAILYRTTDLFLERLGLTSLDELPSVADYLPDIEMLDEFIEQTSS
ncbi:MAG TPA: SMC-Scp complex subunit ScpB [Propionibacteriaceae bacterium]|nr:SMC-Scp complex subunit ScpB [Propionibacteriaceae bacterium]